MTGFNFVKPYQKDALADVVISALAFSGIRTSEKDVYELVLSDASYPSMRTVSEVLEQYQIESVGAKFDSFGELEFEEPFVAQVYDKESNKLDFSLVTKLTASEVVIHAGNSPGGKVISTNDFFAQWSGYALFFEPLEEEQKAAIHNNHPKKKGNAYQLMVVFLLTAFTALWIYKAIDSSSSIYLYVQVALSAIGIYVGFLLMTTEEDLGDAIGEKVCGFFKQTTCSGVLKSPASRIGNISLSQIALSYFIMVLMLDLLLSNSLSYQMSSLALLVIPYSLYVQGVVLKKWCTLCLLVVSILMLKFIFNLLHFGAMPSFSAITSSDLLILFFSLLVASLFVYVLAYYLSEFKARFKTEMNYRKLKRKIFNSDAFLTSGDKINVNMDYATEIGDVGSPISIVVFCALNCRPCSSAYQKIAALLDSGVRISVKIAFCNGAATNNTASTFMKTLAKFRATANDREARQLLDAWYLNYGNNDTIKTALEKYKGIDPLPENPEAANCSALSIFGTPTLAYTDRYTGERQGEKDYHKIDADITVAEVLSFVRNKINTETSYY